MNGQPGAGALEFAPQELRQHGYRDAHAFPLVSPDADKVLRSWRVPAGQAWSFPRVELRTGNSWPCISLDCDGRDSVGRLSEFILDEDLPTPNVIVQRVASGNVHAHYMLATPVHRGDDARVKPLQALARVAKYLSVTLRADRGYNGVLTLNPAWDGPEFQTSYLRKLGTARAQRDRAGRLADPTSTRHHHRAQRSFTAHRNSEKRTGHAPQK